MRLRKKIREEDGREIKREDISLRGETVRRKKEAHG